MLTQIIKHRLILRPVADGGHPADGLALPAVFAAQGVKAGWVRPHLALQDEYFLCAAAADNELLEHDNSYGHELVQNHLLKFILARSNAL